MAFFVVGGFLRRRFDIRRRPEQQLPVWFDGPVIILFCRAAGCNLLGCWPGRHFRPPNAALSRRVSKTCPGLPVPPVIFRQNQILLAGGTHILRASILFQPCPFSAASCHRQIYLPLKWRAVVINSIGSPWLSAMCALRQQQMKNFRMLTISPVKINLCRPVRGRR